MNSQLFASFCDDWFEKDVSNMLIYMNISTNGFNFDDDPEGDSMKAKFNQRLDEIKQQVMEAGQMQMMSPERSESQFSQLNVPRRSAVQNRASA